MLKKINKVTLVFLVYWIITLGLALLVSAEFVLNHFIDRINTILIFERVWLGLGFLLFIITSLQHFNKERKLYKDVSKLETHNNEIKAKLYDRKDDAKSLDQPSEDS
ncbi:MAG: hypothetical protein AAF363_05000 [Bacteroidota bacterium]